MDSSKIAPCDINCSKCPIFIATKNNDEKAAIKACKKYDEKFDSSWCDGCLAGKRLWKRCAACEKRKNAPMNKQS